MSDNRVSRADPHHICSQDVLVDPIVLSVFQNKRSEILDPEVMII